MKNKDWAYMIATMIIVTIFWACAHTLPLHLYYGALAAALSLMMITSWYCLLPTD